MSTVAEIKAAIQRLPIGQVRELAAWLDEYQATIDASATIFAMYDEEESKASEFKAAVRKGMHQLDHGEGIPHEEIKKQLGSWLGE